MAKADYEFIAYSVGIVCASACTSLPNEQAEDKMNQSHPTGISSRWRVSEEAFADGTPNGCKCHDYPDTHRHVLFNC